MLPPRFWQRPEIRLFTTFSDWDDDLNNYGESSLGSDGSQVGSYYGPPATWEALDGSKITGTQLATAANGDGNIPLQLVEANPAEGEGAMMGVSYIQRLNTEGGVAPDVACDADHDGATAVVTYQADYIFWTAN